MNELKVGLLTLAAIACVIYMSLRITANQSGFGEYVEYKTNIDDAAGIIPKTPIKVAGINVGRIKSIDLDGTRAQITFEVLERIKVTQDSLLTIKSVGFLGDKYIEIQLSDRPLPRLEAGSLIKSKSGGGLEALTEGAGDVMVDIKDIVKNIKESMRDDQGNSKVAEIVENLRQLTSSINRIATGNEEKIDRISNSLEKLTAQLAKETDANDQDSLMKKLHKVGPILDNVEAATDDLRVMLADVRAGKGTVGKLLRDDHVADQVSETLSSVNRLVNRINNIEADIALFTGVNTNDGNHTQFDIDIYPAPERFFRLGIVTNDFGPSVEDETERTVTDSSGNATTTTTNEVDKNAIKFNLQIGRKIQRFAFRAGLIESTGGVGVDYFMPGIGARLTSEVFDFSNDDGAYLRLQGEFRLWNVFYTRIALENGFNEDRSGTISAGLRFTDQDLAALIGLIGAR